MCLAPEVGLLGSLHLETVEAEFRLPWLVEPDTLPEIRHRPSSSTLLTLAHKTADSWLKLKFCIGNRTGTPLPGAGSTHACMLTLDLPLSCPTAFHPASQLERPLKCAEAAVPANGHEGVG